MKFANIFPLFRYVIFLAMLVAWIPPAAQAADTYGKELVTTQEIPSTLIARMQGLKLKAVGESTQADMLTADSIDWKGDALKIEPNKPYTLVIKVKAHALEDGRARAMWTGGWANQDGVTRASLIPGHARDDAKAGEAMEFIRGMPPVHFNTDQNPGPKQIAIDGMVIPAVSFAGGENIVIDQVSVEIWSGVSSNGPLANAFAFRGVLLGGVLLVLWWLWFRR